MLLAGIQIRSATDEFVIHKLLQETTGDLSHQRSKPACYQAFVSQSTAPGVSGLIIECCHLPHKMRSQVPQ